jgi:DHA3 family tetracycline resistance protein-like MFS transporter
VIYGLYMVREAGLGPFELVILGTFIESATFLGEVPTGVFADATSRRLSLIIGTAVMGLAHLVMGFSPTFAWIAAGQVLWGFGWTFRSGAEQAWLSDEIGEAEANATFAAAAQQLQIGRLLGVPFTVGLALIDLQAPFLVAGAIYVVLAFGLAATMPERGNLDRRGAHGASEGWRDLLGPAFEGMRVIRRSGTLLALGAAALLAGAWSESLDRLSPLHLVEGIGLPELAGLGEAGWFGAIALATLAGSVGAAGLARRVDVQDPRALGAALAVTVALVIAGALAFALTRNFWVAFAALWLVNCARVPWDPLQLAWVNRGLAPASRATVLSAFGQADAVGQMAGGPVIGAIAAARGVVTALVGSTALLGVVLPVYALASRATPGQTAELLSEEAPLLD